MRAGWLGLAAWGLSVVWGGGGVHAQSAPPSSPFDYVVFGMDSVTLGPHVRVEAGEVGANLGILSLGAGSRVIGGASAFEIRVRPGARARRINCLFIHGSKEFCRNVDIPLSSEALPLVQPIPGVLEIRVPRGTFSIPVDAGHYGRIRVERHATLLLEGGSYDARQLILEPNARLSCQTDCQISLSERVRLGARSAVRTANVDPTPVLQINVLGGQRGVPFATGARSRVSGIVYAPTGTVRLGPGGRYQGTFIGRDVVVRSGARLRFEQQ